MKQKLIYWLPFLLLVGCSQPTYKTTSLAPEKRAELLLKELTLEELLYAANYSVSKAKKKDLSNWQILLFYFTSFMYLC